MGKPIIKRKKGIIAVRKLCRIGGGFAVFLPQVWIEKRSLEVGDDLVLVMDDMIHILPLKSGLILERDDG